MLKKVVILFTFASSIVFANTPLNINGADHQIVFWSFNHQFEKALEMADEKISENPSVPKYYFLKIVALSLKHLADSDEYNFEQRYEYRKEKNLELIDYTESVLEKVEDVEMTPENKFYLANIYGYLGRMYGFEGSYMSAFSNAKEGKDLLEDLVEEYPELYDAYLLLGMFEYYADRLGGITEFVAAVLGFSGDRTTGIRYLQIAQEKGKLTKPFAEFILGETFSLQESNNFAAVSYFERLVKKYPNNKNFYEWYVRILLQLDRLSEAETLVNNDDKNHIGGFVKGTFYLRNGDYEKAYNVLNEAVETKSFKWGGAYRYSIFLRNVTALLLGKPLPTPKSELNEDQRNLFNEIENNLDAAKVVYKFAKEVGHLGIGVEMEIPKIESLPEDGYLRSMYEFYSGVYFYKYRDATRAILFFNNVADRRDHFKSEAAEYLIEIYRSVKPTQQQLSKLEDIIDELDDEDLEFSFMDISG